jgi:hypothetical protein
MSEGAAVTVEKRSSTPIRGNITHFYNVFAGKKMEKKFARGWRSPDRLPLGPPLILTEGLHHNELRNQPRNSF